LHDQSGPADLFLWDDDLPSFGLRLKPSGRRSYIVQYRNTGNVSRRITIGTHGVFTVESARKCARDLLHAARSGGDPAADREVMRTAPNVADFAERYMAQHAKVTCAYMTSGTTSRRWAQPAA
jgi:hypothetical protein